MANGILGIDHVLVTVRDLEISQQAWTRLGFVVTPRGEHPEWGTANHCIMFADDYVELIGPVAAGAQADRLRSFLSARGEGISGLALACDDAAATLRALRSAGVEIGEPRALSRPLQTPEGEVRPQFAILDLPPAVMPVAAAFACQHLTPNLLRRPAWLEHPNGALAIKSVTIAADDPEAVRAPLETLFGAGATIATDSTVAVHTGHGLLLLARPDELSQLHPDPALDEPPEPPATVALTLAVADPDRTAAYLRTRDVPISRDIDGTVRVAPEQASGIFLEFARA